jgi:hypothetical protein
MNDPLVTPRQLSRDMIGVDATPDGAAFPHYCPICFMAFSRVLQTGCCSNTICELCAREMLLKSPLIAAVMKRLSAGRARRSSSGARGARLQTMDAGRAAAALQGAADGDGAVPPMTLAECSDEDGVLSPLAAVACPFCNIASVHFSRVQVTSAPVRNYADSPGVARAQQGSSTPVRPPALSAAVSTTPMRYLSMPSPSRGGGGASPVPDSCAYANILNHPSGTSSAASAPHPFAVPSPVKRGDEFEALRRKLRPMQQLPVHSVHHAEQTPDQPPLASGQQRPPGLPRRGSNSTATGGGRQPELPGAMTGNNTVHGGTAARAPVSAAMAARMAAVDAAARKQRDGAALKERQDREKKKKKETSSCVVM